MKKKREKKRFFMHTGRAVKIVCQISNEEDDKKKFSSLVQGFFSVLLVNANVTRGKFSS
jgi:hypothetical protein